MKKEKFVLINFIILIIIILITLPFTLIVRTNVFNLYKNNIKNNTWLVHDKLPLNIPHGGAKETYPENTLYAYRNVKNYDAFEIDITLTKDFKLITHHNLDIHIPKNNNLYDKDIKEFIGEHNYNDILSLLDDLDYPLIREFNGKSKDTKIDYKTISKQEIKNLGLSPVLLSDILKEFPNKKYIIELKDVISFNSRNYPFLKNPSEKEKEIYKEEFIKGYIKEIKKDNNTFYYRTNKYLEYFSKKAVDELIRLINHYKIEKNILVASFDDDVLKYFKKRTNNKINTIAGGKSAAIAKLFGYYNIFGFDIFSDSSFSLPLNEPVSEELLKTAKKFQFLAHEMIFHIDKNKEYPYYFNLFPYGDYKKKDKNYKIAKNIVDGLHKLGKSVIIWTVNNEEEMEYLINLKVDGIITDDPKLLDKVLKRYKEK